MAKIKIQDRSRYAGETDKQIVDRIKKIQKLLEEFGLKAYAFDPGVRCYTKNSIRVCRAYIDLGSAEWEWLEPLLRELLEYRKKKL